MPDDSCGGSQYFGCGSYRVVSTEIIGTYESDNI